MRFIAPLLMLAATAQAALAEPEFEPPPGVTKALVESADQTHHAAAASPFAGTPYQAIAAIIVFLVVLLLLKKLAWGPILTGLQDRENKIKGDLQAAEKAALDAKATLEDYRRQLANAADEGRKLIEQAKNDAQRVATTQREQAAAEIAVAKQRAEADIRAAKEQALAEVYEQSAILATNVAGKILRREITSTDQQALVRESLAEMNKSGSKN